MFAFTGLVTALIRPEGAILVLLMLVAILFARGMRESRRVLTVFAIVFLLLGGCYFCWRWHYFGYFFPNPFYVKEGGRVHWASLKASSANLVALSGPFALPYLFGLFQTKARGRAIFALIPVAGFTALWALLSNAMNYMMRFQYALLPIVLVSWAGLLEEGGAPLLTLKWNRLQGRVRKLLAVLAGLIVLWVLSFRGETWVSQTGEVDFNGDVAVMLAHYADRGYTLATSEAGLLPLYSKWRTIDTWGLNNPWIAHHGTVTYPYLRQQRPEIIEFHASFSPGLPPAPDPTWPAPQAWYEMSMVLKNYAESNGYCLAAVYGTAPRNAYYYYVRRDFPDSARIIHAIRDMKDVWKAVGWRVVDFAGHADAS
jgi:hypothetical protein